MIDKRLIIVIFLAMTGVARAKCDAHDPRIAEQIKSINTKWENLEKVIKGVKLVGKEVERGRCAATLLRVGAPHPFALPPDESLREAHEAISCLALEKWFLQQECRCGDRGLKFSRNDEDSEIMTLQAYNRIQDLRATAMKIGIPNKAIKAIVERADEIKSCFDMNTVTTLRQIETQIRAAIESVPLTTLQLPTPTMTAPAPPTARGSQVNQGVARPTPLPPSQPPSQKHLESPGSSFGSPQPVRLQPTDQHQRGLSHPNGNDQQDYSAVTAPTPPGPGPQGEGPRQSGDLSGNVSPQPVRLQPTDQHQRGLSPQNGNNQQDYSAVTAPTPPGPGPQGEGPRQSGDLSGNVSPRKNAPGPGGVRVDVRPTIDTEDLSSLRYRVLRANRP